MPMVNINKYICISEIKAKISKSVLTSDKLFVNGLNVQLHKEEKLLLIPCKDRHWFVNFNGFAHLSPTSLSFNFIFICCT